ncbi:membrane protein [Iodidimonas nitroreducens]|uniref:Membrane protein n=1 Tax=Iodidimonas nitroreducens TaxID=1236968 RepID=A0A5A7N334_9PROT|nr:DMT family transporter [Iodidimonas nitroreducens]GAK32165.1 putative transporter [alpha proteobacterium Q-1]GER02681.1 membrane protein [Iodidimonas nitroreducens]
MIDKALSKPASRAFAALLLGAVGIGFAPIFVRLSDVGPVSSAFWRIALSIPLLMLWLALRHMRRHPPKPPSAVLDPAVDAIGDLKAQGHKLLTRHRGLLILCGLFFAADLGLWHWSITLTSVANATLLANLNPVFVALFSFVLFKERFSGLFLLGLMAAMAGAIILMGVSLRFSPERLLGDGLGVATALMYAGYFMTASRLRAHIGALEVLLWTAIVTALALLPVAYGSGETLWPETPQGWLILWGLAVICQIMGQGLIIYALAHLPAAFSALSLLLQPVVASLAAWLLFAESMGGRELIGALMVLLGIGLARLSTLRAGKAGSLPLAPKDKGA